MKPGANQTLAAVLMGAVLAAANLILIRYVGLWLVYSGWAGVGLYAGLLVSQFVAGSLLRRQLFNLLLVLTLINFNGWAFSHLGNLMGLIGLFFFALFGLILGAALFRLLSHYRPITKPLLVAAGMVVVLACWFGALNLEAAYVPNDAAYFYRGKMVRLPKPLSILEVEDKIRSDTRQFLLDRYGDGGVIGYLRWAAQNGSITIRPTEEADKVEYQLKHRRGLFLIRLCVSLLLLTYAVFTQISQLTMTEEQVQARKDAKRKAAEEAEQQQP